MIQILSGSYFLAVASFGLYSMYRNDEAITNRWLFLCGWFLWGCMMCLAANTFLTYAVIHGHITVLQLNLFYKGFTAIAYSPLAGLIFSIGFIFYNMYLFSLRKRCMEAELIPRTFSIWVIKLWRKIFNKNTYNKTKTNADISQVN